MYADYEYYKNGYGGTLLKSETAIFFLRKANQLVKKETFNRIDENNITKEIKNCVCEIADIFFNYEEEQVKSVNNGSLSMTVEKKSNTVSIDKQLKNCLELWLFDTNLLYKGVIYGDTKTF